jgi:2-polyprenyl-3-methyl-5-hydroxy-6-metoxy-1,4-benzoquinol methylase
VFDLVLDQKLDMLITSPKPSNEDLGKYYESEAYISHTDSSKSLLDKVYQVVKNYAIKQKIKLINSFNSEKKNILDIGCGTGDFLVACKKEDWLVYGVEPSSKARDLTLQKLIEKNNSIENTIEETIEDFISDNQAIKQYDVVTLWHVLEHVPNLKEYIKQLKELLKPNGTLFIAVPNYKSYDANHYKEFWAAFDVPRHLWHFSKKAIKVLFEKENFSIKKIIPMKLDSFYVSLLSEKYKTGKSKLIKPFFIGLLSNIKAISTKEYSSLIYIIKNK